MHEMSPWAIGGSHGSSVMRRRTHRTGVPGVAAAWIAWAADSFADSEFVEGRRPPPRRSPRLWAASLAGWCAASPGTKAARWPAGPTSKPRSAIEVFFCEPRSPWQRPTNEQTNALMRRWHQPRHLAAAPCGHRGRTQPHATPTPRLAISRRHLHSTHLQPPVELAHQWRYFLSLSRTSTTSPTGASVSSRTATTSALAQQACPSRAAHE